MLDARLLYRAYQITGELNLGDVTAGLAQAAKELNHKFEDGELREYREFLGRHNASCLGGVYEEGYETFEAAFNQCLAENAAKEEEKDEESE